MKKLNAALFLLGVGFLTYLILRVGPADLGRQLQHLGWGVLPLIASEGLANLAHALGWRHCLNRAHQHLRLGRLFCLGTAGYAINYLTPSASLGGEVARASLLASGQRGPEAASSVLADKLSLAVGHLLLVGLGSLVLLWQVPLPPRLWLAMGLCGGLITAGVIGFFWVQTHGKLGALLRWLAARRIGGKTLLAAAQQLSQVDHALQQFYRERPLDLVLSVLWHLLGHSMAIFQTWLFLRLLHQPASLGNAACVAFIGLWFDLLTFAVPLNLGALEGSRILALKAVGGQAVLGVTLGLALRIAQLFWAGFGLAYYGLVVTRSRPSTSHAPSPSAPLEPASPHGRLAVPGLKDGMSTPRRDSIP